MDECNFKKKDVAYTIDDVVASVYDEEPGNVSTGDDDTRRYLFYQLSLSMAKATQIDIIVSYCQSALCLFNQHVFSHLLQLKCFLP